MAKSFAAIFGVIYTLIGILGFIPSLVTNGALLGVAPINTLHNVVHLVIGLAGLGMSRSDANAATYCKLFGIILLLLGIVGFTTIIPANVVPLGGNDRWLHLVTGLLLVFAGFSSPAAAKAPASS